MNKKDYELQIRYKALFMSPAQVQWALENQTTPFGAHNKRMRDFTFNFYQEDSVYVDAMEEILNAYPNVAASNKPIQVFDNVFIGTSADAENHDKLARFKITHLLNLVGGTETIETPIKNPIFPQDSPIQKARTFPWVDKDYINIISEFPQCFLFMDVAKIEGGNVLLYSKGVSCTGALAIAYMIQNGLTLLQATRKLKYARNVCLTNRGFMKELVRFARMKGLLDPDVKPYQEPKYNMAPNARLLLKASEFR